MGLPERGRKPMGIAESKLNRDRMPKTYHILDTIKDVLEDQDISGDFVRELQRHAAENDYTQEQWEALKNSVFAAMFYGLMLNYEDLKGVVCDEFAPILYEELRE